MCHPEFRLYLISRSSRPAFSTEVSSITTLVNLRLDEEALAEEIEIEAFHRVQPELYVEGRKSLMVMMELLRLLENIDNKLIGLVTARQGTDIWEETEVIAELVKCRSEVSETTSSLTRIPLPWGRGCLQPEILDNLSCQLMAGGPRIKSQSVAVSPCYLHIGHAFNLQGLQMFIFLRKCEIFTSQLINGVIWSGFLLFNRQNLL